MERRRRIIVIDDTSSSSSSESEVAIPPPPPRRRHNVDTDHDDSSSAASSVANQLRHLQLTPLANGWQCIDNDSYTWPHDTAFSIPRTLYQQLFDFQVAGVTWLGGLHAQGIGGILGDDMGMVRTENGGICKYSLENRAKPTLRVPSLVD